MKKTMILVITALCSFGAMAQTVPSYVPTNGLVGWWPFNGNANDVSGNGLNGTVNGAILSNDRNGNVNTAYSFNGINNYIQVSHNQLLNTPNVTIALWYNAIDYGFNQGTMVSKRESAGWGNSFELSLFNNNSNIVWAPFTVGGTNDWVFHDSLTVNNWIHVVYTHDNFGAKIYIDGNYTDNTTISGGLTNNILPLCFGARPNAGANSQFYHGKLDDIGIWNRALTACEVFNLYNSGNGMSLSANSQTVCSGQPVVLTAIGATNYTWSTGATSSSITVSPTANAIYSVSTTYVVGCSETKTVSVTVNALPTVSVNSGSICNGQSFVMVPTGATTYTYSSGSATVMPSTTTTYTVTGANGLGCASTAVSTVTVNALPTITAVSSNTLLCVGQTASLTAAGALTYTWSNGNTGSTIVVTPTSTANYTVTGTNALNCSNATVLSVSVSPCTGIEQLSQTDKMVNLYPNPTTSQLYISADFKFAFLQVLNSIGQLVFTKEATTTIDASSLSHGIYFIKLYNEQGQLLKVAKFIKE